MSRNYGVTLSKDLDKYELEATKTYLTGVEEMMNEFPQLKGEIREIGGKIGGKAFAGMTFDGRLHLNPKKMKQLSQAEAGFKSNVDSGFHPQGATAKGITVHEMGHAVEAYLIRKKYPEGQPKYAINRALSWNKGDVAKEIVSSAMDRAVKGWRRDKSLATSAVQSISRYAASNASETIAEAVCDYMANRSNAKPLSREIWNELKNRVK